MYSATELKFMYKNLAHDFSESGKLLPELKTILRLLSREEQEQPATLDAVLPMNAFITFMRAIPKGQARANKFLKANCPAKPFCIRASQASLREHIEKVKGKRFEEQEPSFQTAKDTLAKEESEMLDYDDLCTFFTYFRFCKDCVKNGLIVIEEPEEEEPEEEESVAENDNETKETPSLLAAANVVIAAERLSALSEEKDQEAEVEEEAKTEEEKTEETKTEKAKTEEKKTEEAKTEEAKTEEAKTEEAKTEEAKTEETKTEEAKTDEAKTDEAKTEEAKTEEAKTDEAKTEEAKTEEAKTEEEKSKQEHITIEISEQAKI